MASTYTAAGIELITTGEQSGTWGATTNTNLELIEELAAGVVSVALTGTTHTLTTSDGVSSDGRHAVVVFTGTPGGTCTVTISPNDMQKVYLVKNNSDQTVTLTQGSGATVDVNADDSAIVYCDGAGAGAAVNTITSGGGGISYVSKTANYTVSAGEGVLADTSGGAFTVTLPSGPSEGDEVVVADSGGDWGTNNLTIARNGSTIEGAAQDLVCNIDSVSVQLVYDGSTWQVYAQVGVTDSDVLVSSDIGSTVQAYDADTAKYDDTTANFTGTLQNGGSNVVVDSDIGSTVQAYDADTTKNDVANTFTADQTISGELKVTSYNETYAAVTSSSGALTIDCEAGNVFSLSLSENVTSSTFSNPPASGTAYAFALRVIQDSTARTIAWPASVDWAAATAPTLSSGSGDVDWFVFNTVDGGTTWYGFTSGQELG